MSSSEDCVDYGSSVSNMDFSFYTKVASVAFVWWVLLIVFNLGKPRQILRAISWSALRVTMPRAAGLLAIKASKTLKESITIYYDGLPVHSGNQAGPDEPYTTGKLAKILFFKMFIDIFFSLVPAVNLLATRRACLSEAGIWTTLGPSFWFYPDVPGPLFGVWIVSNAWFFKLCWGWSLVCCYVILVAMGIGLFLSSFLNTDSGTTSLPILAYVFMSVPFALWGGQFKFMWIIMGVLYGVVARNFTISLAALWQEEVIATLPEWFGKIDAFAISFLIVGCICSGFSVWGLCMKDGPRHVLKSMKERQPRPAMNQPETAEVVNSTPGSDDSVAIPPKVRWATRLTETEV